MDTAQRGRRSAAATGAGMAEGIIDVATSTVDQGTATSPPGVEWVRTILARVPLTLGHRPEPGSVVAVGVEGLGAGEPRLVARTTVDVLVRSWGSTVVRSTAAHLRAMGCGAAMAVTYRSSEGHEGGPEWACPDQEPSPGEPLASLSPRAPQIVADPTCDLRAACLDSGIEWLGTWSVGPTTVRREPDGLDAGPADFSDTGIGTGALMAREDLGHVQPASHRDRRAAAEGRLRWQQNRPRPEPDDVDQVSVWGDWQRRTLRRWEQGLADPEQVPRAALGRIEAGLGDRLIVEATAALLFGEGAPSAPSVTDSAEPCFFGLPESAVIQRLTAPAAWVPLGPAGSDPTTLPVRPWLADLLVPGAVPPDRDLAYRAEVLLCRVLAHGRRHYQSGTHTLLALLAWARGAGPLGAVLLERALADHVVDPVAEQLDWLFATGMLPGWAHVGIAELW